MNTRIGKLAKIVFILLFVFNLTQTQLVQAQEGTTSTPEPTAVESPTVRDTVVATDTHPVETPTDPMAVPTLTQAVDQSSETATVEATTTPASESTSAFIPRMDSSICAPVTEIPQSECEALVAFYNSTGGGNWTNQTNWLQTDTPCSWYGVSCGNGHVTSILLNQNQLSGSIPAQLGNLSNLNGLILWNNQLSGSVPSELGNLAYLRNLNLGNNQLNGSIPPQLGNLTNLTDLELAANQLSGTIPPQLGNLSNLTMLRLGGNHSLGGTIPPELGNLTNLTFLDLENDHLTGTIPPELGNLTNLTYLNPGANQLTGSIPIELGSLTKLTQLDLSDNQLSGNIPPQLGNLTNLTYLRLSDNQLSGTIPPELGNLTNLQTLHLRANQLSGNIPPELGNLTQLNYLYLNGNQLSGNIPPELGNLTDLTFFSLRDNQLSGGIPPELGNLAELTSFDLTNNQLSGNIPPELGNLTQLNYLYLNGNQLSGSIPHELGNLTNLANLVLSNNQLSGSIPPGLGNVTKLTWIDLNQNQLSGSIPPELGNLTNLTNLDLLDNKLSGSIPPELGNLTELTSLDLNENQLSGSIPSELGNLTNLTNLGFYHNQLSGSIPSELGNLTNLTNLGLNQNQLSGNIPSELGNLTKLTGLWLDINQLSGSIPSELGNLTNLTDLELNQNQLSGNIPPELGNLSNLTFFSLRDNQLSGGIPFELGNLTELTYLDLTNNQLSGSIPPELGKLTELTDLDLNQNLLSGSIPPELGNLTNLTNFGLYNNQLSGSIPTELGKLTELTDLGFNQNQLSGSIPSELGNLTKLTGLELSYNQLSGSIPSELGYLTKLTYLDLSSNQLSGNIPPELGNLTKITDLNLSRNQLSGSVPTELGNLTNLTSLWLNNNQLSGSIPPELGNLTHLTRLGLSDNQLSGSLPLQLENLTQLILFYFNNTNLCEPDGTAFQTWLNSISDLEGTHLCSATTYIISGNAGIAGATLSYTDGTPKTATANGSGDYTLTISSNWSGTVTPSKAGYNFIPDHIDYENVHADQVDQNYAATNSIKVTVQDTDGAAKAGVTVYAFDGTAYTGYNASTDSHGQAVFTLQQGSYRFRADLNGTQFWSSDTNNCTVPGCNSANVTFTKPLVVTVQDTTGVHQPNLPVYSFNGTTYTGYSGKTDSNGQVILTLPQGNYRFRSDLNGTQFWSSTSNTCTLPGCTSAEVTVSQPVMITVLDNGSTPHGGIPVYAFNGTTYTGYNGTTDANGMVKLTLPLGTYRFRADSNGTQFWSSGTNNCTLPGCLNGLITITLPILISIRDTGGAPKSGLPVYAFNETTYTGYNGTTDVNGHVSLTLPEGSYRFRTDLNGTQFWSGTTNNCTVPTCTDASIAVTQPVAVHVTDTSGAPKPDIPVYAFDGTTYTGYNSTTDASGQVTLTLPLGSYHFRADLSGTQFWSSDANNCTVPGCTSAAVTVTNGVLVTVQDTSNTPKAVLNVFAFNGPTYTGFSGKTNSNGQAVVTLPQGSYHFRTDLNGTQFWSSATNNCTVPNCGSATVTVTQPLMVTVQDTDGAPKIGLNVYAFTGTTYTGYSGTTNASGQVTLTLPQGSNRFRADLNGTQFWSSDTNNCTLPGCLSAEVIVTKPLTITVQHGSGTPESGVIIYTFNGSSYTGYSGRTDVNGRVVFTLPQGSYHFRADYGNAQYWSSNQNNCTLPGCGNVVITVGI